MRLWRWPVLVVGALLVSFVILKESREPYVWLFVDDWLHPKPTPITVGMSDGLAVRLYAGTQPHIGKIARLQKGLVLLVDGQEVVEEGFGFGLPFIVMDGQAFLARSGSVEQVGNRLVKRFHMDTMDTPSGFLRRKYEPTPPLGTVTVTYTVEAGEIGVVADFTELEMPWDQAYMMTEQGARFFTRYEEPGKSLTPGGGQGRAVEGEAFGRWQPTVTRQGCIVARDLSVRFCVETEAETHRYFGREMYLQYYWIGAYALSWAGNDIELKAPVDRFAYRITLQRSNRE